MPDTPAPAPTLQDLINALTAVLAKAAPAPAAAPSSAISSALADVEAEIAKIKAAAGVVDNEFASTRSFFGSAHGLTRVVEFVVMGFAVVGAAAIANGALHLFHVL